MTTPDVSEELVEIAAKALAAHWDKEGTRQHWSGYKPEVRDVLTAIAPALIAESHKTRCAESRHDWKLATDQPPLRIYSVCKWCRAKSYPPDYSPQEIK